MQDVKVSDLENPRRLLLLFIDAERSGLVRPCDADKLAFSAAAERAKRVATRNSPGCFVHIIRKNRYAFIAQEDEDRGRRALQSVLYEDRKLDKVQRATR